jgi:S1-C subfamily serine protease
MFGFNWVDLIILFLLEAAFYAGLRIGLLTLLLGFGGFFAGLFFGGWLFPHLLPFHDRTLLTIINANLVLILAIYAGLKGFDWGRQLHFSLKGKWHYVESGLGLTLSLSSCLIAVWLIGGGISRLPFVGLSNSTSDAFIEQKLDAQLPPIPAVIAEFDRQADPNSSPFLFVQPKPQADFNFSPEQFNQATAKAVASIVRITSFGCGGVVSGSGFVVGPNLVATNAHVVAGSKRPIVKYGGASYEGQPVVFDVNLDFAVLRTAGLVAAPLKLATTDLGSDTTVAMLGYPGGNFDVRPGIIRDNQTVFGRNIYDEAVVGRDVYEVQAAVDDGNSGGPIVLANGQAAGMIFSKFDSVPGYGFALTSSHLIDDVKQAQKSTRRVSTGVCLAN